MNDMNVESVRVPNGHGIRSGHDEDMVKFIVLREAEGLRLLIGRVRYHAYLLIPRSNMPEDLRLFMNEGEHIRQHPLAADVVAAGRVQVELGPGWTVTSMSISQWDSIAFSLMTPKELRAPISEAITLDLIKELFKSRA